MSVRSRVAMLAIATAAATLPFAAFGGSAAQAGIPGTYGASSGISPGSDIFSGTDAQLGQELDTIAASGAQYLRVDFAWSSVQGGGATSWDWSGIDRVVNAALARGLKIDALATYAPSWETGQAGDKHAPANPQDFYQFVYQAGLRYLPAGVTTWEMWNEANITGFMNPTSPALYTTNVLIPGSNAIRAAATAVHANATVLTSGLAPSYTDGANYSPADFVSGIYAAGGKGHFDAVGLHPYSWPYAPMTAGSWNTFANTPALHQIMANNGDGALKIWGTEWGYPTGSCTGCVSEAAQATFLQQGFAQWHSWSFTGPLFVYSFHDSGTNASDPEANFGLTRHDFTAKPSLATFTQMNAQADPNAVLVSTTTSSSTTTASPTTTAPPTTTSPPTTVVHTPSPPTTVVHTPSPPRTTVAPSRYSHRHHR